MHSRRTFYLILLFVCVLAFTVRQAYFSNQWRQYRNKNANFALAYPATWFRIPLYHCSTCQYIKLFVMNVPVIDQIELRVYSANRDDLRQQGSISFGEWIIHQNSKHVNILRRKNITVGKGGYSGREILFEDKTFRGRIITLQHHEQVYAIEVHAIKEKWNEADGIFDKILETFEFLE